MGTLQRDANVSKNILHLLILTIDICPTRKSEPKVHVGHNKNLAGPQGH